MVIVLFRMMVLSGLLSCPLTILGQANTNNADSLHNIIADKNSTDEDRVAALNRLAEYYREDSTALSLTLATEALNLSVRLGNKREEGLAKQNLAEALLYNDAYGEALLYASNAYEIFKASEKQEDIASVLTTLGWIYYDAGDPGNALLYHQRALAIHRKLNSPVLLAAGLNAVGLVYAVTSRPGKALPFFQESLSISKTVNKPNRIAAALNNIGMIQQALGHYDEALQSLSQAFEISKGEDDKLKQAENLNQMAVVYIKLKDYEKGKTLLLESRKLIENTSTNAKKEKLLDNVEISANLYSLIHDYEQAFLFQKEFERLQNDISSAEKRNKLAQNRLWYETQKKEQEIKLLEQEKELRLFQRNALAGGILLLGIIGYLAYSRQRQIRLKERQLGEMQKTLIRKELERASLEKEALESKLVYKNSELTNFALHISQRNELLRSFLNELSMIRAMTTPEVSSRLGKVMGQFSHMQEINKDAEDFHLNVEAEYHEFFFNLNNTFPDLTENEKRLCAQVRLNLSNKDIASLNNVAVKSVEMARYRLRKRFNLAHDENLAEFLKKF